MQNTFMLEEYLGYIIYNFIQSRDKIIIFLIKENEFIIQSFSFQILEWKEISFHFEWEKILSGKRSHSILF